MSRAELMQLAGNTRFGFQKMVSGKIVVRAGENVQQLFFLVSGTLGLETTADDHSYCVVEQLQAPWLLQPDALFGYNTRYMHTVRTLSEAHFIMLSKDEVLRLLDDFLIIRLNLLNILSTYSQRITRQPWRTAPRTLQERIVRFFINHSVYPAGQKDFYILMKQLALEVGDTRLNVSRVLNHLQSQRLLTLGRGCIHIPSLEYMIMSRGDE